MKSSPNPHKMKGNLGGNMPKKLLLAEDSLTIRKIFELVLSRSDIAVTAVPPEAIATRSATGRQ